jgi:hypothetical protein
MAVVGSPELEGTNVEYVYPLASIAIFAFEPIEQGNAVLFTNESGTDVVINANQKVAGLRDFRTNDLVAKSFLNVSPTWLGSNAGLKFESFSSERIGIKFETQFVGTMIIATTNGTYPLEVNIPQGEFDYLFGDFNGSQSSPVLAILFYPNQEIGQLIDEEMVRLFERGAGPISTLQTSGDIFVGFNENWMNRNDIIKFPAIEFTVGNTFQRAWQSCTNLQTFKKIIVSEGLDFRNAWQACTNLIDFGQIDFPKATNFSSSWRSCSSLLSFPLISVPNGTNFSNAWRDCSSLTSFSQIQFTKGNNFSSAWQGCSSLTSFPTVNFPSVVVGNRSNSNEAFRDTWRDCTSLSDFPPNVFDNCPTRNYTNAFVNCALTQQSVDNILVSLVASNVTLGEISITGGTNAPPGPTGIAARDTLLSRNWIVNVNS